MLPMIHAEDLAPMLEMQVTFNALKVIADPIFFRDAANLEFLLKYATEDTVINSLNRCIEEEWNEGILICEKAIEERGFHVGDIEGRFEL